jgi:hypothetical protein
MEVNTIHKNPFLHRVYVLGGRQTTNNNNNNTNPSKVHGRSQKVLKTEIE